MADQRVSAGVVLLDKTTRTQGAAVDASGNVSAKLAANSGVDIGDVDVASVLPGTGATNLGKAEDAAHTTGDVGVMALAVRKDTPSTGIGADGDYVPLAVDANGRLQVTDPNAGTGAPSSPSTVRGSSTDLAAGSSFNVGNATESATKKLRGFTASSSLPFKAFCRPVDNDVDDADEGVVLYGQGGEPVVFIAPHPDFFSHAFGATAGFDGWRLTVTNLDQSQAADAHGTLMIQS